MRRLVLAAVVAVGSFMIAVPTAGAASSSYGAVLSGANEVPGPGDPDGTGEARITIDTVANRVCVQLFTSNIATPTLAHIHSGAAGVAGPVVVDLTAALGFDPARTCVIDADADAIAANPSAYYVNVHNAAFPAGAVRGQLSSNAVQVIDIPGFSYTPSTVHVQVGDAVVWQLTGGEPHSAKNTGAFAFDTGELVPGEISAPVIATTPGTYVYFCGIHGQSMQATLIVDAAPPVDVPEVPWTILLALSVGVVMFGGVVLQARRSRQVV